MAAREPWSRVWMSVALSGIIAAGIAWWQRGAQLTSGLDYRIVSLTPIGPSQAAGFGDLRLLHKDEVLVAPFLLSLIIENTGELDIPADAFATPLFVRIVPGGLLIFPGLLATGELRELSGVKKYPIEQPGATRVVAARVASTRPSPLNVALSVKPTEVEIAPLLLNRGDQIGLELLVTGPAPGATVSGRIKGVPQIRDVTPTEQGKHEEFPFLWLGLLGVLLFWPAMYLATAKKPPGPGIYLFFATWVLTFFPMREVAPSV